MLFRRFFSITKPFKKKHQLVEIDFVKYSFKELGLILKDATSSMTIFQQYILAEWENENFLLKIEFDEEGNFKKLVQLKLKIN